MLKQIIIGGIVGGFTLFLWGLISWAVMDWHHATVRQDAGVEAVVENISDHLPETGVHYFPCVNTSRRILPDWNIECDIVPRSQHAFG